MQSFVWNHKSIGAIKAPAKDERHKVPGAPNLVLKIARSGVKSWVWQGRVKGEPHTQTIGTFSDMGLADARERALEIRGMVDAGATRADLTGKTAAEEPSPEVAAPVGVTCQQAWDLYLAYLAKEKKPDGSPKNKAKTIYEKGNFWRLYLQTEIGEQALSSVTHDQLDDIVETIRETGKNATADTLIAYLSAFFRWCTRGSARRKTKLEVSPAASLVKSGGVSRTRYLSDDEIRLLWKALDQEDDVWADGYRLALLTGQRKMEIFGLMLHEIVPEKKLIDLPGERTKNGLPHIVPLGDMAWSIIERRMKKTNRLMFASLDAESEGSVSGFSRVQQRIRKSVEKLAQEAQPGATVAEWRLHDLRRTFSSLVNGILGDDEQPLVAAGHVEAVLNHISGGDRSGVAGTYNRHQYLAEKRRALRVWEDRLKVILGMSNHIDINEPESA
ncbi:MAG: tyrosine-type recombinase/integrase [Sphingobium sp.]